MNRPFIEHLPEDWLPAAAVFAALGDPMRQKILLMFSSGEELSIKQIVEAFPLSRTAIVHHLGVLERADVLASRRDGREALYSVKPKTVLAALDALRDYIFAEFPNLDGKGENI